MLALAHGKAELNQLQMAGIKMYVKIGDGLRK
jgi:hypothetical protein